jgi:glutamine synthetase
MAVAEGTAVTDIEQFVAQDGRDDQVAEVDELIEREKVQYVYYQFPSVTGRIMGKGVPARHWRSMAQKGFQLVYGSTANLFTDRHGNYIGYGPEAAELVGVPEPDTFAVLPWDRRVARVWCTCFRNREERDDPGGFLT